MAAIEASLQRELLSCTVCQTKTRTLPVEGVPAQALRYGLRCGHDFFMRLPDFHS